MKNSSKTGLSLIETYGHDAKLGLLVPNNHEDKVSRFVAPKQSSPHKNTKDQQKYTVVVISDSFTTAGLSHAKEFPHVIVPHSVLDTPL